jgi:hypothetical protein
MIEPREDALLDRNLRTIGRALDLPSASAEQRESWKSPPESRSLSIASRSHASPVASGDHTESKGAWFMRKPRVFAACSTAVAATIALCAFFLTPSPSSQAMAATILRSFKEAVHRGLSFELDNIQVEGVHVDGRVQVVFPTEITLKRLVEEDETLPEPDSVLIEMRVRGDDSNEEVAGLDVEISAAFTEAQQWAFLRVAGLPDEVIREEPAAALVTSFLRGGILLDLAGLDELEGVGDIHKQISEAFGAHATGHHAAAKADSSDDDDDNDADDDGDADEKTAGSDANEARMEAVVHEFLTGTASAERIGEFVQEIEKLAGRVDTRQIEPGVWELNASDFKTEGMDADEAELIGKAAFSIRYKQGAGIISAELTNVGELHGRLRFGFVDAVDPSLASMQRYVERGIRPVKVTELVNMFGGMMNNAGKD